MVSDLNDLNIEENLEFLDITAKFIADAATLPNNQVSKSTSFSLFEGTHALEIGSASLDTGLIKLSQAEHQWFDPVKPLLLPVLNGGIKDVVSLTEQLFRLVFVWMGNNHTLSTSVLSCVYVERLLDNYTKRLELKYATFFGAGAGAEAEAETGPEQLNKAEKRLGELRSSNKQDSDDIKDEIVELQNFILTHKVFRAIVLAVVSFVAFIQKLAKQGILYEEEDIIMQVPDLNLLENSKEIEVLQELVIASLWLTKHYSVQVVSSSEAELEENKKALDLLNQFLSIFRHLFEFDKLISRNFQFNIHDDVLYTGSLITKQLFDPFNLKFLQNIIASLQKISQEADFLKKLKNQHLSGCFSPGIQKRLSNSRPFNKLASPDEIDYQTILTSYFANTQEYLVNLCSLNNADYLKTHNFLQKTYYNSNKNNLLLRVFLQLFYVRDSKSILGSHSLYLVNLLLGDMNYVSCYGTNVFNFILGTNQNTNLAVLDFAPADFVNQDQLSSPTTLENSARILLDYQLSGLSKEAYSDKDLAPLRKNFVDNLLYMENFYFELVVNISNNPSRQRQILSRMIVQFDSLQVAIQEFEDNLQQNYGILESSADAPAPYKDLDVGFPLTVYVYYKKLEVMLSYLWKGIELDIYKPWEFVLVYTYNSHLLFAMHQTLERQIKFNDLKIYRVKKKLDELQSTSSASTTAATTAKAKKKNNNKHVKNSKNLANEYANVSKTFKNDLKFNYYYNSIINTVSKSADGYEQYKTAAVEILNQKLIALMKIGSHLHKLRLQNEGESQLSYAIFHLLTAYNYLGFIQPPNFGIISNMIRKHYPEAHSLAAAGEEGDNDTTSEAKFIEKLYHLRFKSFSSVGVPEFIPYSQFKSDYDAVCAKFIGGGSGSKDHKAEIVSLSSLREPLDGILGTLSEAKTYFKNVIDQQKVAVNAGCGNGNDHGSDPQLIEAEEAKRINELAKSAVGWSLSVYKFKHLIDEAQKHFKRDVVSKKEFISYYRENEFNLTIYQEDITKANGEACNYHRYYPLMIIEKLGSV